MSKLRWLLALSCLASACAPDAAVDVSDPYGLDDYDPEPSRLPAARAGEVRVRVVAANVTSGNQQAYLDPGIRILRGLEPDVALVQEFNYGTNSATDIRRFVDQAFGPEFVYYREPGNMQIPNGIVSRYPILEAGTVDDTLVGNRNFAWARIDVPGPVDLVAISVHLLTSSQSNRFAEANQLVTLIRMFPGDYVVLGGDFNTSVRTEPAITSLSQVLVTGEPYPTDLGGLSGTNASRSKPYDWVLGNPALDALEVPVVIGLNEFPAGFVADTRVYTPIADLAPALTSDSAATNMQHMAVARDFSLPDDAAPQVLTLHAPNGGETWAAGSSQQITWTAENIEEVSVELSLDGTSWSTIATHVDAAAGSLTWTVPSSASTTARVRVTAVDSDVSDTSEAAFSITVPVPTLPRVMINEILANEPGSNTDGEFIEIVNAGNGEADLSGWTLSDAAAVRHVFPSGTRLGARRAIVIYGNNAPAGFVSASTRSLSLSNGGDTVTLRNGSAVISQVSFTSSLSGTDGVSMTRSTDADPAASFILHGSGRTSSPGTRADGTAF